MQPSAWEELMADARRKRASSSPDVYRAWGFLNLHHLLLAGSDGGGSAGYCPPVELPLYEHDASLIGKVETYLKDHDMSGVDVSIAKPVDAINKAMKAARGGTNSISVTGSVPRGNRRQPSAIRWLRSPAAPVTLPGARGAPRRSAP